MELFSKGGYHGTTMPAIAAHLKLSRSSVYYTFRAKSALFVQALRRYTDIGRGSGRGRGAWQVRDIPVTALAVKKAGRGRAPHQSCGPFASSITACPSEDSTAVQNDTGTMMTDFSKS